MALSKTDKKIMEDYLKQSAVDAGYSSVEEYLQSLSTIRPDSLTCDICQDKDCQYRDDLYNTDGDCLALK